MPIFTNTSAIWGTLIFLGLIAVYIYKRRSRNILVSSLMFFSKSRSTAEGGQKLHKLQTPLLFFIELLIFLFIILAIADPMSLHRGQLIPVSIILDDSVSMTAGGENSPYKLSLKYLENNIFSQSLYRITLILVGNKPKQIGRRDMNPYEADNALMNWKCESNTSNLMEAVAQELELGEDDSIVIVLTDHLEEKKNHSERIKWVSFGKPLDNFAITGANRSSNGKTDRCFFEFTNFSSKDKEIHAEIIDETNNQLLEQVTGIISANSSRRAIVKVRDQKAVLKAVIKSDDIDYDNEVVLLPIKKEKLKVSLKFENKQLSEIVKKAVLATELAQLTSEKPQVIISDKKIKGDENLLTELVIHNATESYFFNKMIASDKEHMLTADLPLENALWAVDKDLKKSGKTLLAEGDLPLLSLDDNSELWSTLTLNYSFSKSNLHQTSFWPVFFYNLMEWTLQRQEGPSSNNFRSGSRIEVGVDNKTTSLFLQRETGTSDKNEKTEGIVKNKKALFVAGRPGIYSIFNEDKTKNYKISVNLCSYEESDLSKSKPSEKLPEIITNENMVHFESVKWWFILIAFALLILHQWLISNRRSGYAF
jgi:hypothetical protein